MAWQAIKRVLLEHCCPLGCLASVPPTGSESRLITGRVTQTRLLVAAISEAEGRAGVFQGQDRDDACSLDGRHKLAGMSVNESLSRREERTH